MAEMMCTSSLLVFCGIKLGDEIGRNHQIVVLCSQHIKLYSQMFNFAV